MNDEKFELTSTTSKAQITSLDQTSSGIQSADIDSCKDGIDKEKDAPLTSSVRGRLEEWPYLRSQQASREWFR